MSDKKFTAKEWNASGAFQFYGSVTPRSYIIEIDTTSKIHGGVFTEGNR